VEVPSAKFQAPEKLQAASTNCSNAILFTMRIYTPVFWNLVLGYSLALGCWSLVFIDVVKKIRITRRNY
jgi:hypothetical protein